MKITRETLDQIHSHALQEYPLECCGIVTGTAAGQTVHRCRNIQNRLHGEDPGRHPRGAQIAYAIDRQEFDGIISSAREKGEEVIALYHSHPDHGAYFSEEDHAAQTVFGDPEFPGALQVIVSVMGGTVSDTKCYLWDRDAGAFRAAQGLS
ncbi:MAG: M67 family metallopeptidase [Nitrospiraceae bacterium]|nr:MAG: M67 family metallopeptidase [Nitrospiraceae bacterium]